jgi:ATP-dependent Clp protease ATP-binding subunit ClpC
MRLSFEPEKSEVFEIAQFILIWDNLAILAIRILLLGLFLFLAIFFDQAFSFGIFLLLLSFEIFYKFKVKRYQSRLNVLTLPSGGNLASVFDLDLAKIYLSSHGSPVSLLSQLLGELEPQIFLARIGIDKENFQKLTEQKDDRSFDLSAAIERGLELAKVHGSNHIDLLCIFQGFFLVAEPLQKLAFDLDVKEEDLDNIAFWVREEVQDFKRPIINLSELTSSPGIAQDWISGYTLETRRYTRDITKGLISGWTSVHLVGREKELDQIEEILSRDRKKNVILIGEPGVGKTTIVFGLAARCFSGHVIPQLRYKRILEFSLRDLLSAADQGELARRLTSILDEIENAGDVIFYVPDMENIAGAQTGIGKVDLTGTFLPTLRGANVQVIGSATPKGYTRYIEGRPTFAEEFDKVVIAEPEEQEAVKIVEQAALKIEKKQKVTFTYKAILTAVTLSDRYMKDRMLPGKAIDLVDQAAVKVVHAGRDRVLEDDVVELISEKKKIPLEVAKGEEKERLLTLETILHERVVDQNEAIEVISQALRRARTFVREERRPIGAFLFLGPTGVGKTETARAFSSAYFGGEEEIIRLDMSEYQTFDSVERLIGSSPGLGEEKGRLTEAVRAKPFALILLDEMEKAHRSVLEIFLQVFDEGRLTDAYGTTVDFTQTIIIATSNAGAEQIREAIMAKKDLQKFKDELVDYLLKNGIFTPEFLNRFDEVVLFKPLSEDDLEQVVKIQMNSVAQTLEKQEITIEPSEALVLWLVKIGYDPVFGARPLRRLIQEKVEGFLAEKILAGEISRGDRLLLDHTGDEEIIYIKKGRKFAAA